MKLNGGSMGIWAVAREVRQASIELPARRRRVIWETKKLRARSAGSTDASPRSSHFGLVTCALSPSETWKYFRSVVDTVQQRTILAAIVVGKQSLTEE